MTQINEALIRQYAAGASDHGITNLLTLLDFLAKQTTRAEELSRAYLKQMTVLQARLESERGGARAVQTPSREQPAMQTQASSRAASGMGSPRKPSSPRPTPSSDPIEIDL